jgi:hypothetical protein
MPNYYTSRKFKLITAKKFRDAFKNEAERKVGYVFIGKSTPWLNEPEPEDVYDTLKTEKQSWDSMIAAKKIIPGDVEFVLPRLDWEANSRYKQFDDAANIDFLLSETVDGANNVIKPMYVVHEDRVYKCICNNVSTLSTVPPTGTYIQNNGFISTEDNPSQQIGYLWKYMYTIRPSNPFYTSEWIPVPYGIEGINEIDYDMDESNFLDGSLNKIVVTNKGNGYYNTTVNVDSFVSGTNIIRVSDPDIFFPNSNIKIDMSISGIGILQGTHITALNNTTNQIVLSQPTISSGGGGTSNNIISINTRIVIDGDGTETITTPRLVDGQIEKIDVINAGINFTRANVIIYGSGSGAAARVVLPPKFGHGFNPANELGAKDVMINKRIGEVDSTENNKIPNETKFREYGLLISPYKYGSNVRVSDANANTVVSLTTDVTVLAGTEYEVGELVYQGLPSNPSFKGSVVSQDSFVIRLTQVEGTIALGTRLIGANSDISRPTVSIKYPDLEPYTGDILYTKNISAIQRSDGQAEEFKLIFQF